ncbi:DEP domain-containing protein 1A-like isoform X1 [Carcharodon carcharias]|uniref:DEP domain-containing protein 1A-like isoform X1 n=1 Tax=Carcharodon carcharias TaxID=13397 RepID=UPI001B7E3B4B|nr:DEP domain-containing protein 1A-like isoform X1 [Carcharodon carcharias]
MESRIITPGPYRATKLWNELTKLFRAGMPLRKHRLHLKKYNNCFTASEAVDWLHKLLRNNSNFGPEVSRQQTLQLLRKFLKNHVIEDIKGRWGAENLDDNSQLYRFPTTSPLKVVPSHPPFYKTNATRASTKAKGGFCEFPKKMPKEKESLQLQVNTEETDKEMQGIISEGQTIHVRQVTQTDVEEAWREIVLNHLQKILGLASLDDVLDFSQVIPQHILYNVRNVSKHGVVILQDKSEDLPHWVLSAMKCLANWPRNNDLTQPSYPGFERDVFKTVADYFLSLPEPLLTFEHYELFVNILVLCGYIMVSNRQQGKRKNLDELSCPQPAKSQHLNSHINSFKSTECLLLSLICKDISKENNPLFEPEQQQGEMQCTSVEKLNRNEHNLQKGCARRLNQCAKSCRKADVKEQQMGGSCQNLTNLKNDHKQHSSIKSKCYSVGNIVNLSSGDKLHKPLCHTVLNEARHQDDNKQYHDQDMQYLAKCRPKAESMSNLYLESDRQQISNSTSMCSSAWTLTESSKESWTNYKNQELLKGESTNSINKISVHCQDQQNWNIQSRRLHHLSKMSCQELNTTSNSKVFKDIGSHFNINAPVAEVTVKPDFSAQLGLRRPSTLSLAATEDCDYPASDGALVFQCHKCAEHGSEHPSTGCHSTFVGCLNGTQSLLQPQLEQVAIEALQICCLFLPPPNRRKLQLLMRMISRISQNVDMPQLHEAMGTRMLVVQTFSHCILRCEKEADLDELLGTRLVSFILDHHQEILQVPPYLRNAVDNHINHLQRVQITYPCTNINATVPMYAFCQQISTKEFEEQRVSVSQVAIAELLENIVEDKKLSAKDKRKKLKQFQKEYPEIYQNRFPATDSEAKLFLDKPKIKPPMLITMKKPLKSLQKMQSLRY